MGCIVTSVFWSCESSCVYKVDFLKYLMEGRNALKYIARYLLYTELSYISRLYCIA